MAYPKRIVCLSAESADWLCRIGAWDRVVGVTAYYSQRSDVAPKPRVSGFSSARIDDIVNLRPDLVITFSDVQANISAELIRRGVQVLATNPRSLDEIEQTLQLLARIVGSEARAEPLVSKFKKALMQLKRPATPTRVYFEEWPDPLVTGIGWVSELIERAGGRDVFAHLREERSWNGRRVRAEEVRAADPEIIFASWCGKAVDFDALSRRPGWKDITAVRQGRLIEIPADEILQPGFLLIYGFERIRAQILRHVPAC